MKKRISNMLRTPSALLFIFFTAIQLFPLSLGAQHAVSGSEVSAGALQQLSSNDTLMHFRFTFPGMHFRQVEQQGVSYTQLLVPELSFNELAGRPDLPSCSEMIPLPQEAGFEVKVKILHDTLINLSLSGYSGLVIPADPPVSKASFRGAVFYPPDSLVYRTDAFYPAASPIELKKAGVLRKQNMGLLKIFPVQYNPVQKVLRVILEAEFSLHFSNPVGPAGAAYAGLPFEQAFLRQYLPARKNTKESIVQSPIKYVILADSSFRQVLQPFIRWKTSMGYRVVEGYKGTAGPGSTQASMKAWLKALYDAATPEDPAPGFLLICGDVDQIPPYDKGHYTDLYYAEYDGGGDYFPDLYYGRFSANDTAELKVQLDKTMQYEQYLLPQPSYLDTVILIAGDDASYAEIWGNGQINYAANTYFNAENGFFPHTYPYPYAGSKSLEIIDKMRHGAGFVNYTGHGYENRWVSPYFTVSHADTLNNFGKYSLFVTNGCMTNQFGFGGSDCLGEALLKVPGAGAIGCIGGANDTYWDEDFYWSVGNGLISANPQYDKKGLAFYDRVMHTHGEPFSEWYATQSQMIYAGNLAVTASGSSLAKYYWEVYNLLGDPSLMPYFGVPSLPETHLPAYLPAGASSMMAGAEPGSYIGLSKNEEFLAAASVDSSRLASLFFSPLVQGDTIQIVVSRQNRIPHTVRIPVLNPAHAYLVTDSVLVNDQLSRMPNSKADYGEEVELNVALRNLGMADATTISLLLRCTDPYVSLLDSSASVSSIAAGSNLHFPGCFRIAIADEVPDGHKVWFDLFMKDALDSNWYFRFSLPLNAPRIKLGPFTVHDSVTGNGNQRIEQGEHFSLRAAIHNTGHSMAIGVKLQLDQLGYTCLLGDSIWLIDTLASGASASVETKGWLDTSCPAGEPLIFRVLSDFQNQPDSAFLQRLAGLPEEDFETGDLSRYPWKGTAAAWSVVPEVGVDGSYSARSAKIGASSYTDMELWLFSPDTGSISFWYKLSSELNFDFLLFYIDSDWKLLKSGITEWMHASIPAPAGWHRYKWRYQKDDNTTQGKDCAWVDAIVFPSGSTTDTTVNLALTSVIHPVGDSAWKLDESLQIRVVNRGQVNAFLDHAGYLLDGMLPVEEHIGEWITPGRTYDYVFQNPMVLDRFDRYQLMAYINAPLETASTDDTIRVSFLRLPTDLAPERTVFLHAWPNPCKHELQLETNGEFIQASLQVWNIAGQLLLEEHIERGSRHSLQTSALPAGLYLLRVADGRKVFTTRFAVFHTE